ncbi:MAG: UbiD family decarboxylase [Deltaproteobacteria bacterium]|nr:UbiD family decarboxylase [Deltaproteobacteria bacterium]MBI3079094.1 UbiD family decarboxylase [Deltaproteobacteria bacterium]
MAKDLRSYLEDLGKRAPQEIKVISREVDPTFGVTGIAEKFEKQGEYPALYFRKIKGSKLPLVINVGATYQRLAWALETTVQEMVERWAKGEQGALPVKEVAVGPVKEVVLKGNDVDLSLLPITTHNALDGGAYIAAGVSLLRDPDSGRINGGIYRHQVHGKQTLGLMINPANHGNYVRVRYREMNKPMEIAIIVGHHPAFLMSAVSKLPGIGGELEVAGGLLGENLPVCRGETVDLPIPAYAEIAIEGIVEPGAVKYEGPFGEWPGYYMMQGDRPFITVTAITMRRDAIYQDLFNAHPEHQILGALPRMGSILRRTREVVPGTRAVNLPISGCGRCYCYISIKKRAEGEPKQAAFAALATEPNIIEVVVVDEDINVFNETDVLWAKATRFDPAKDLIIMQNCLGGHLNPTAHDYTGLGKGVLQTKMISDATKPLPPIQFPERAMVPTEVIEKIDLSTGVEEFTGF